MMDTYVINLDKDKEKWQTIQQKFSWKLMRVPAIDGSAVKDRPFFASKLMYGCLLSHRKVWDMIAQSNKPSLVLEDDCHPLEGFDNKLELFLKTLPEDYDVAVLGYVVSDVRRDYLLSAFTAPFMKRRCMRQVNEDWFIPGVFFGTHCYIVSPQGARKLLANPLIYHTDFLISTNTNLHIYCPKETLASQILHQHEPWLYYNPYLTWDWLLVEPMLNFGTFFTLRFCHLVIMMILFVGVCIRSQSLLWKNIVKILIFFCLVHYLCTISHISHNLQYGKTREHKVFDKKEKLYSMWNDLFSIISLLVLLWVSFQKRRLIATINVLMIAFLLRAWINNFFIMKDPSGVCEEKSVSKYSLFEYCGSLMISGHILPSVVLLFLMPSVGIIFVIVQSLLILRSESHYKKDILHGIILMVVVWYAYQKFTSKSTKK